ncbi:MAG: type II secretion system F family protein [Planctomycetes bacterium]|nr:type II secretion system F family protein [Planctomycetota bacterium]
MSPKPTLQASLASIQTASARGGARRAAAELARQSSHREGARLLAQREGAMPIMAESRAKPGPVKQRDRMFFFSQLAVMVGAGVPIAVALDGIARQTDKLRMRDVLKDVLGRVEGGQPFSTGLLAHPRIFPLSAVHLVRAGETSGDLTGMLRRVCSLLEREYDMKKKLRSALTYPLVMLGLAVVTVIALFAFILPRFRMLYAGREDALPRPTRLLLAAGDLAGAHAWQILAVAGAAAAAVVFFLRTPRGHSFRDSFVLALPLLGPVVRKFSLARSVRTMGALLQSGVPVLAALELARDLSSNMRLGEAWEYVRQQVANGGRIHEGMLGQNWFPGTLVQMTAMGEAGGILDGVLVKIGEFYDQEAEMAVQEATSLLEPIMVVVVGGVVGFIAMSIMLPIFNMSKITH